MRIRDTAELAKIGVMKITLTGPTEESFLAERPFIWWEWTYGDRSAGGDWASWSTGYANEPREIEIHTPHGELTVDWRKLRPHLAPVFERTFRAGDADLPAAAADWLEQGSDQVSVAEYGLEPGREYWASVEVEGYSVPDPDSPDAREQYSNWVIPISDAPFDDNQPTRPLTPSFRDWSY